MKRYAIAAAVARAAEALDVAIVDAAAVVVVVAVDDAAAVASVAAPHHPPTTKHLSEIKHKK